MTTKRQAQQQSLFGPETTAVGSGESPPIVVFVGIPTGTLLAWLNAFRAGINLWSYLSGRRFELITGEVGTKDRSQVARRIAEAVVRDADVCLLLAGPSWGLGFEYGIAAAEGIPTYVALRQSEVASRVIRPLARGAYAEGMTLNEGELRDAVAQFLFAYATEIDARQRRRLLRPSSSEPLRQRFARDLQLADDLTRRRLAREHGLSTAGLDAMLMSPEFFAQARVGLVLAVGEALAALSGQAEAHRDVGPLTPREYQAFLRAQEEAARTGSPWDDELAALILQIGRRRAQHRLDRERAGVSLRQSLNHYTAWLKIARDAS